MEKQEIKEIAEVCFTAGKNDWQDKNFNELFERLWEELTKNEKKV